MKKNKKETLLAILLLMALWSYAQHLAAYSDQQRKFYVFDAGETKKLEDLDILDYQVGGICLAYIANNGALKAYYNSKVYDLEIGGPAIKYKATDYLLGWKVNDFLKVFDQGEIITLSTATKGYQIQDSLIAWYDYIKQAVYVYYNKEIITVEDGLLDFPVDNLVAGDNIVAYRTTFDDQFKAFYQGEVFTLDNLGSNNIYKAGRDILGWTDLSRNLFKVGYKGEVYELDYFAPRSFQVGDEIIAFIDYMDNFRVYEKGIQYDILTYPPDYYEVTDEVLIFFDQGFFKTFCNGSVQIIERFIPDVYAIDWKTIAYIDQNKNVVIVQNCEKKIVTYEVVHDIELIRDLIVYKVGVNISKIYYFGQVFERR